MRQEELARQRRSEHDLAERPKTDPWKARIARRLRQETTMTLVWVAHRLRMGSVNMVKHTLRLAKGGGFARLGSIPPVPVRGAAGAAGLPAVSRRVIFPV